MNKNRKLGKKATAIAAACAIGLTTVACGTVAMYTQNQEQTTQAAKNDSDAKTLENALTSTSFGDSQSTDEKVETVYVSSSANGSPTDIIVSDWLRNYDGADTLTDSSSLKDIENVKGDESYTTNSDGTITWDAKGNDIYYQGSTSNDLPVGVKVTYYLDGKEISAADLAGKSGKVKIRFDYTNTAKEIIDVNGQQEEITVPFAMVSGLILPTDNFSNIQVTNGKVISDADNNIVMGVALPGLTDALDLDKDKLSDLGLDVNTSIPEYVEITADTIDFELGMTMTLASPNVLSDLGFSDFDNSDSINKLNDDMTLLQDGMKQLTDGSSALADGSNSLYDGSKKLFQGTQSLAGGAATLSNGTKDLYNGITTYTNGVAQVTTGLETLNSKVSELAAGTQSLADGTNTLKQSLAAADTSELQNLISMYNTVNSQLTSTDSAYASRLATANNLADASGESTVINQQIASVNSDDIGNAVLNELTGGVQAALTQSGMSVDTDTAKSITSYAIVMAQQNGETVNEQFLNSSAFQTYVIQSAQAIMTGNVTPQALAQYQAAVVTNLGTETLSTVTATVKNTLSAMGSTVSDEQASMITKYAIYLASADGVTVNSTFFHSDSFTAYVQNSATTLQALQAKAASAITPAQASAIISSRGYESITDSSDISAEDQMWLATTGMTKEEWDYISTWATVNDASQSTAAEYIVKYTAFQQKYAKLTAAYASLTGNLSKLAAGVDLLNEGANTLNTQVQTALVPGVSDLYNGTALLNSNSSALLSGAGALQNGASQLKDGANTLSNGTNSLMSGADLLASGANELNSGLIKFDNEGVQKLADAFEGDVTSFANRLHAIDEASKSYDSFSGHSDEMSSTVKFLIETDAVEK